MRFDKKGSLEISIQAIVIVVLAMTLLGLGLGFIKGMFKDITSTTTEVTQQIKEQILDDLRRGDQKISFPSSRIGIGKGESEVLGIGIKNKLDSPLFYKLTFNGVSGPRSGGGTQPLAPNAVDNWFQFDSDKIYKLESTDVDVRSIRLEIPRSTLSGPYLVIFEVNLCESETSCTSGEAYDEKEMFIEVRG